MATKKRIVKHQIVRVQEGEKRIFDIEVSRGDFWLPYHIQITIEATEKPKGRPWSGIDNTPRNITVILPNHDSTRVQQVGNSVRIEPIMYPF